MVTTQITVELNHQFFQNQVKCHICKGKKYLNNRKNVVWDIEPVLHELVVVDLHNVPAAVMAVVCL